MFRAPIVLFAILALIAPQVSADTLDSVKVPGQDRPSVITFDADLLQLVRTPSGPECPVKILANDCGIPSPSIECVANYESGEIGCTVCAGQDGYGDFPVDRDGIMDRRIGVGGPSHDGYGPYSYIAMC